MKTKNVTDIVIRSTENGVILSTTNTPAYIKDGEVVVDHPKTYVFSDINELFAFLKHYFVVTEDKL